MSTVGQVIEYEGFEYICTAVDDGKQTSTWIRKDHVPKSEVVP